MSHRHILRSHYFVLICSNLILDSIDPVGHPIRCANIEVFSEPNFLVYGQNPRTYTIQGQNFLRDSITGLGL